MNVAQLKVKFASVFVLSLLMSSAIAQSTINQQNAHAGPTQTAASALASLPEADTVIYASPQRILNEAAPKVVSATELAKLRAEFVDLKRTIGIDPASVEFVAIAVRFNKPQADLSFVAPDVLAVLSGDFSADSMATLIGSLLQDQAKTEAYRSKTLTLFKVDPIAESAVKNPILKSFAELGVVALNSNTLALGTIPYLKSAVDASEGDGRINPMMLNSLLRDPNALISASGSPLVAFTKSFGMLGTQTTPREATCNTRFGEFYSSVTLVGTNFSLRGAINTDNPDTTKIMHSLISSLLEPAIGAIPDKQAQELIKRVKMSPRENEIVWEADVATETVATYYREQTQPKPIPTTTTKPAATKPKRRIRRKS
ncbi:MAG: hypothetical protein DMF69_13695 [Acidobacteria bacterium]|nr:MAG: hypothetical protein DMF69_13695 [Acidobacteriota bacterium]